MTRAETERERGRLKVYLGYAAGAGKTYRMLEEAQHAKAGTDVVIGYLSPMLEKTRSQTEGRKFVPRRHLEYRGSDFEEMDMDAILKRAPAVCLVDEFAHSTSPGQSKQTMGFVLALLDCNIDVWTTMNLQHLESLNDQIFQISGQVRETVPDWVLKRASEVIMVDVTPEALVNRLKRGVV